jgi:hypothetical protein
MKTSNVFCFLKTESRFVSLTRAGFASCLLCATLAWPRLATSAVLVEDESFSGIPNMNQNLNFKQWDTEWGTLNSITLELHLTSEGGALRVDNDSGSPSSSSVQFGARGALTSADVFLFTAGFASILSGGNALLVTTSQSLSLAANNGDVEVGGTANFSTQGADYGQVLGGTVNGTGTGVVGAAFWAFGSKGFIGTSTFNINVAADQFVNLGSLSGAQQQIDPLSVNGFVRLIYDYDGMGPPTPVPEPSSMMVLTVFGVFLARVARSKRRTMMARRELELNIV